MIDIRNNIKNTSLVILTVLLFSLNWFSEMNALADSYIDDGMKRSMIVFAIAKVLNAAVSVLQTTNFSIQPLGVGFGISFGEILDPLNDIIEIFSDFMLFSSLAFGIQKVLIMLSGHTAIKVATSVMLLAVLLFSFKANSLPKWILKLSFIFLMIRFAIPITAIGSNNLFNSTLKDQYESGKTSIESIGTEFDSMTPSAIVPIEKNNQTNKTIEIPIPDISIPKAPKIPSFKLPKLPKIPWWSEDDQNTPVDSPETTTPEPVLSKKWQIQIPTIPSIPSLEDLKQHASMFKKRIIELGDSASKSIVDLIVVFLMQSIIFPFGILFVLYQTSKVVLLS